MTARWHITRGVGELTLSRQLPARFDVSASTTLPEGDPLRLAHQIRQDMWRRLQKVRGFSPVVQLTREGDAIRITAGGRVAGPVAPGLSAEIAALLGCPAHRARWVAQAKRSQRRF